LGAGEALGIAAALVDGGAAVSIGLKDVNTANYHSGYILEQVAQGDFLRFARISLANAVRGTAGHLNMQGSGSAFFGIGLVPSQTATCLSDSSAYTYCVGLFGSAAKPQAFAPRYFRIQTWNGSAMSTTADGNTLGNSIDIAITRKGAGAACVFQTWVAPAGSKAYVLAGELNDVSLDAAGTLLVVSRNVTAGYKWLGLVERYGTLATLPGRGA